MVKLDAFLKNADQIAAESPSYKLGHDGSDGECDCIGLIIGAIRRSGGTWSGTVENLRHNQSLVLCFDDGSAASRELSQMGATLVRTEELSDFQNFTPEPSLLL